MLKTAVSGLKSEIPVLPLHWVLKSSNKSLCHKAFVRIKGIETHRGIVSRIQEVVSLRTVIRSTPPH